MFGETTISYVKIGNHPIDGQPFINGWLQGVPGFLDPKKTWGPGNGFHFLFLGE